MGGSALELQVDEPADAPTFSPADMAAPKVPTRPYNPEEMASAMIEIVRSRDKRIGELRYVIAKVEQALAERNGQCTYMERALHSANTDLAHMELDLSSQKHRLQLADNHFQDMM